MSKGRSDIGGQRIKWTKRSVEDQVVIIKDAGTGEFIGDFPFVTVVTTEPGKGTFELDGQTILVDYGLASEWIGQIWVTEIALGHCGPDVFDWWLKHFWGE